MLINIGHLGTIKPRLIIIRRVKWLVSQKLSGMESINTFKKLASDALAGDGGSPPVIVEFIALTAEQHRR